MSNPYTPPSSDVDNKIQERSSIPKVIGIISLVLAGLGILGALASIGMSFFIPEMLEAQTKMGFSKEYILGSNVISVFTSLWAVFIGIKLLKYLDIGRRHYNYYAIFAVVMSIFAFFYTRSMTKNMFSEMKPEMAKAAQDLSSLSSVAVFIAPIIIIMVALLLNQQRVKDSLK